MVDEKLVQLARHVSARLERLSVDSYWAHHASGLRRSLLRCIDDLVDDPANTALQDHLQALVDRAFTIVEQAARDMGDRK